MKAALFCTTRYAGPAQKGVWPVPADSYSAEIAEQSMQRLAQRLAQRFSNHARDDVGRAPWRERHHQPDGLVRIRLGQAQGGRQGQAQGHEEGWDVHVQVSRDQQVGMLLLRPCPHEAR